MVLWVGNVEVEECGKWKMSFHRFDDGHTGLRSSSMTASTVISFSVHRPFTPSCSSWTCMLLASAKTQAKPTQKTSKNEQQSEDVQNDLPIFPGSPCSIHLKNIRCAKLWASTVSFKPPVGATMGRVPRRMASIWTKPQGSHLMERSHFFHVF